MEGARFSNTTALLDVAAKLIESYVALTLWDLSKAFDVVSLGQAG